MMARHSVAPARPRVVLASSLALLVALTGVVVAAVAAEGYRTFETKLNDGGVWVTNNRDGAYGRVNKPIGQVDGTVFAESESQLDIVQDGAAVVGVNVSSGLLAPIDPAAMAHPEGERAQVASSAQVQSNGGVLAVLDGATGRLWLAEADPSTGVPSVRSLDSTADPVAEVGGSAALTVSDSGVVWVVSAEDDTVWRVDASGAEVLRKLESDMGEDLEITAVGGRLAVLDRTTGVLEVVDGPVTDVATGAVLQQPGATSDQVLIGTADRLIGIDLATGETETVSDAGSGRPTAPVRLGGCVFGAWSGDRAQVATRCGTDPATVADLGTDAGDLVFRVNRGQILLNDRLTGAVWNVDSEVPTRVDNWEAFRFDPLDSKDEEDNEQEDLGDRRPPQAMPDEFGARTGRTTVLHPLDNDTAPVGRLLAIVGVKDPVGSDATLTISPDGQTVQIRLPPGARTTTFTYFIDDGRETGDSATVTVTPRAETVNEPPARIEDLEPRIWTVPSGGTLDVPVLPDWRDRADGDPLSLASATARGGVRSGAVARTTANGRIRLTAPAQAGSVTVAYSVSDGVGEPVEDTLEFEVQGRKEQRSVPAVAEPDVVAGETGKAITIRPLANDLPGSDPVNPDAVVELAGRVAEVAGAEVSTDLVEGTITFRSSEAKTFFVDYEAKFGNAVFDPGRIRVDVRASDKPPKPPVALPDSVTLYDQSPTLVDVLANDIDPTGGILVVQRAQADVAGQLDVAVVDGRWLRISVRGAQLRPNPVVVRYTISNGARSEVQGEVIVTQRPAPEDTTPVTAVDRIVVRAGGVATVPVLDNDFSPTGDELELVRDVADQDGAGELSVSSAGDDQDDLGRAFVTGSFVRYVAPASIQDAQSYVVRYVATTSAGQSSPGRLEIKVVPERRRNSPPQPPALEGRAVAGDIIKLNVPGSGVDPDGDPVTLTAIDSAPALGRIVRFGATSLRYQAYPGSVGTDEFSYSVTDPQGGTASGSVRIAVVPPGAPQPPLAVADALTVEPGRQARVDVLGNDFVADGDRVEVELVDPAQGITLASPQGPVLIDAPDEGRRNVEVLYTIANGLDESRAPITVRVREPYNNPPVVFDAFGEADDGNTVTVDVLEEALDPDGPSNQLRVTDVFGPADLTTSIDGGRITVQRGPAPQVVPFRVTDADGGMASASLFVPPLDQGAPFARPGVAITLDPGETRDLDLDDYVVDPSGGSVQFTLKNRIFPSPVEGLNGSIADTARFTLTAARQYAGPAAIAFEVTTGTTVDDPEGISAIVSVPVQVGVERPILRCPDDRIEIAQGQTISLDVSALCHVLTPNPDGALSLVYEADWSTSADGLSIIEPRGEVIEVAADGVAATGASAVLQLTSQGSEPDLLEIEVVEAPSPSLSPIRIEDLQAGESRTVDLADYLRPGVPNPEPTVVSATQATSLDATITTSGSEVTITAGPTVDGQAQFDVVVSDVAGDAGPERQVTGTIALEILDVPEAPTAPVPGAAVRDAEAALTWRAPEANGAPIDRYEVRAAGGGAVTPCPTTACEVRGLTNGQTYRFEVRARNAIGWSRWSPPSTQVTPDVVPGLVGPITLTKEGDGEITFSWTPPTTQSSKIVQYHVSVAGRERRLTTKQTRIRVTELDNNRAYDFQVAAENDLDIGEYRTSDTWQSIGDPGTPAAPDIRPEVTAGSSGAVTLTWAAVDPNGPAPVRYTVLRNGDPLPGCANQTATTCDNEGITYDGTTYTYKVRATNKNGEGRTSTGSGRSYSAVGKPAAWQPWDLAPTGANNQARAQFTVPDSRGARSTVKIYIDGVVQFQQEARGAQSVTVNVPDNDGPHTGFLEVCNEANECSRSDERSVQTYGPFTANYIVRVTPETNRSKVTWNITVDTNGDPATVRVRSSYRDETFTANVPDTYSFSTRTVDVGYSTEETITVTLSDSSPNRAAVSKTVSVRTENAPEPTVRVSRGSKCRDGTSNPCGGSSSNGTLCLHSSCGRVVITTTNFTRDNTTCDIYDNVDGRWVTKSVQTNRSVQTSAYFGFPDRQIWAICSGGPGGSPVRYDWPNS